MTLAIHVVETIAVRDVLAQLAGVIRRIVNWLTPQNEEGEDQDVVGEDENRGPPTLGVFVVEDIKTKDKGPGQ